LTVLFRFAHAEALGHRSSPGRARQLLDAAAAPVARPASTMAAPEAVFIAGRGLFEFPDQTKDRQPLRGRESVRKGTGVGGVPCYGYNRLNGLQTIL
jgi:hypothetical protein